MDIKLFNLLEEKATEIAVLARAGFERDHPTAAASAGARLDEIFRKAVEAFVDIFVTGQPNEWDACMQELLSLEWRDVEILLDVPLGLVRAICDRIVELSKPDANSVGQATHWLTVIEETGQKMACRLVQSYQDRLEGHAMSERGARD